MNAERLSELLNAHANSLCLYASRWTNMPEDCVQEAFIALSAQQEEPKDIASWLFRVVKNKAINTSRGETRRKNREQIALEIKNPHKGNGPENQLDTDELNIALQQLETETYEIIVLRLWSNLSFEQIADVLEYSVSTAHRKYHQAIDELRKALKQLEQNHATK